MEQKGVELSRIELILGRTDGIEVGQANNEKKPIFLKVSGLLIRMSTDQAFNLKQDLERVLFTRWKEEER